MSTPLYVSLNVVGDPVNGDYNDKHTIYSVVTVPSDSTPIVTIQNLKVVDQAFSLNWIYQNLSPNDTLQVWGKNASKASSITIPRQTSQFYPTPLPFTFNIPFTNGLTSGMQVVLTNFPDVLIETLVGGQYIDLLNGTFTTLSGTNSTSFIINVNIPTGTTTIGVPVPDGNILFTNGLSPEEFTLLKTTTCSAQYFSIKNATYYGVALVVPGKYNDSKTTTPLISSGAVGSITYAGTKKNTIQWTSSNFSNTSKVNIWLFDGANWAINTTSTIGAGEAKLLNVNDNQTYRLALNVVNDPLFNDYNNYVPVGTNYGTYTNTGLLTIQSAYESGENTIINWTYSGSPTDQLQIFVQLTAPQVYVTLPIYQEIILVNTVTCGNSGTIQIPKPTLPQPWIRYVTSAYNFYYNFPETSPGYTVKLVVPNSYNNSITFINQTSFWPFYNITPTNSDIVINYYAVLNKYNLKLLVTYENILPTDILEVWSFVNEEPTLVSYFMLCDNQYLNIPEFYFSEKFALRVAGKYNDDLRITDTFSYFYFGIDPFQTSIVTSSSIPLYWISSTFEAGDPVYIHYGTGGALTDVVTTTVGNNRYPSPGPNTICGTYTLTGLQPNTVYSIMIIPISFTGGAYNIVSNYNGNTITTATVGNTITYAPLPDVVGYQIFPTPTYCPVNIYNIYNVSNKTYVDWVLSYLNSNFTYRFVNFDGSLLATENIPAANSNVETPINIFYNTGTNINNNPLYPTKPNDFTIYVYDTNQNIICTSISCNVTVKNLININSSYLTNAGLAVVNWSTGLSTSSPFSYTFTYNGTILASGTTSESGRPMITPLIPTPPTNSTLTVTVRGHSQTFTFNPNTIPINPSGPGYYYYNSKPTPTPILTYDISSLYTTTNSISFILTTNDTRTLNFMITDNSTGNYYLYSVPVSPSGSVTNAFLTSGIPPGTHSLNLAIKDSNTYLVYQYNYTVTI